jgi:hypothetical protein
MRIRLVRTIVEKIPIEAACIYRISDIDDEGYLKEECDRISKARGYVPFSLIRNENGLWTAKFNVRSIRDMTMGENAAWHYLEMENLCGSKPGNCQDCPFQGMECPMDDRRMAACKVKLVGLDFVE